MARCLKIEKTLAAESQGSYCEALQVTMVDRAAHSKDPDGVCRHDLTTLLKSE